MIPKSQIIWELVYQEEEKQSKEQEGFSLTAFLEVAWQLQMKLFPLPVSTHPLVKHKSYSRPILTM